MDAKTATVAEHANSHPTDHAQGDRLEVPEVSWYKDPGLRKLYAMIPVLFLRATINGYDGSLLNGLQTLKPWQDYFDHPQSSRIGLFTAMQNIDALAAMPFSAVVADRFDRRMGVTVGLIVLLVGVIIQVVPSVDSNQFIGGQFLIGFGRAPQSRP